MTQFNDMFGGGHLGGNPLEANTVPKIVGGFNIPKATIENKVDVLTFLEVLVRKNLVTSQEIDQIRGQVVDYLNTLYPELKLGWTTPPPPQDVMASAQSPPASPLASMPSFGKTTGPLAPPAGPSAASILGPAVPPPGLQPPSAPAKKLPPAGGKKSSSPLFPGLSPPKQPEP